MLEVLGAGWIVPLGTVRVPVDGVKAFEVEFIANVVFVAVPLPFVIDDIEDGEGVPEDPVLNGVDIDTGCVAVFVRVVEGGGVGGTRVSLVRVERPDEGLDSGGEVSESVTVREEEIGDVGDENGGGIDVDASTGI